ncbi:hypothetical protein XENOCAPTIV_002057 [Xenoophorus captivus]|uniref:TIR domain-containing protein n=1 Tax=Xenoophorus captivus TaxID=1517983 RepID=A0ABV0R2Y8_9TELE
MLPENTTAINLSKNMIRAIPPGAFARFAGLKHLDLSQNKLFNMKGEEFKSLHLMVFLNLSCNNISNIHSNTFEGLTSLKVLLLSQNYLSGVFGLLFYLLPAIEVVDLSLNRLRSFSCEECGGSLTLKYLNLSVNNMQKVNVSCFPALTYIQLSNNTELELRPDTFDSNQQLSTLLLQSVKVEGLMGLSGQTKRDLIHVSFSMFAEKSPWMICDVLREMDNVSKVECDNGRSRYLWQFDDKACSYDQISLTLFISCTVMDVLFVFVCLAWHIQGPTLRFLLLMVKVRLRGRKRCAGAKFQYDAFISYSSKDEDWVMGQLVPNLERPDVGAPRLRLCLHHRDFRPGAAVLENIEAAIYSSRHTICVVTRSYLQSEWCSVEFQLASVRLLCDGSDVLLMVFLEEIPEHCLSPYARLRRIVHRKTYLLWPENPVEQDAFWVRLKDALKDSKDLEEEGEGDVGGEQWLAPLIG